MPVYEYKGFDAKGKNTKGLREADSERALRTVLRKEGVRITSLKDASGKGGDKKKGEGGGVLNREISFKGLQRISIDDIGVATRQLATLLQAGVPMVESLTALIDQVDNSAFKNILAQVKTDVNEGLALHQAMEKHKRVFDHIFVNMVRAGESSGTLDIVLERLADFKEGQARLKGQIIGAMIYPVIMLGVAVIVMALLFVVVVPRITKIFEHADAQLPWTTQTLIWISEFARDWWFLVIGGTIAGTIGLRRWARTEKGKAVFDRLSLQVPIFGPLFRMVGVARFARTLGTLLQAGVSLLTSLEITKNVVNNAVLSDAIEVTREAIREGEEIAPPLKRSKQFPPMVTHMIAIGEKSGQLEGMLLRVATAFEERVDARLKGLTALLEPVMIVGMAVGVGFVVFSIMMPILQMNTLVK